MDPIGLKHFGIWYSECVLEMSVWGKFSCVQQNSCQTESPRIRPTCCTYPSKCNSDNKKGMSDR